MATINGKKLNQLRVAELQAQLENRGLDKSGIKSTLVDHLQKCLLDDLTVVLTSTNKPGKLDQINCSVLDSSYEETSLKEQQSVLSDTLHNKFIDQSEQVGNGALFHSPSPVKAKGLVNDCAHINI